MEYPRLENTISKLGKLLPSSLNKYAEKLVQGLQSGDSNKSDRQSSARAAISVFMLRVAGAVLALLLQVFLARWMGSENYGIFVLVWVIAIVLGSFSCLGMQTAVIRFVTEYRTKNDGEKLRALLLFAPGMSLIAASIIAAIGISFIIFMPVHIPEYYIVPFILAFICLPIFAMEEVQEGIARSFDMPMVALGPVFIIRPVAILVLMYFAYIAGFEPNAKTAMVVAILASILSTTIQGGALWVHVINYLKTEHPKSGSHGTSPDTRGKSSYLISQWIKVALPVFMAGSFYNLLANTDVLLIGHFLEPENVAVYFAAVKSLALVHFVQFALRSVTAHHFSRYFTNGDFDGLGLYARKIAQWSFWPTLVFAITIALFGKFILAMFGSQFVEGQILLMILGTGIVVRAMIGPAESLLSMSGQQNILVAILGITLLLNLSLNIILIPWFGLVGAASATCIAMIIESLILFTMVYRRLGFSLFIFDAGLLSRSKGQTV